MSNIYIVGATYEFDNITLGIFPSNYDLFDGNIIKVMLSNAYVAPTMKLTTFRLYEQQRPFSTDKGMLFKHIVAQLVLVTLYGDTDLAQHWLR